MQRNDELLASEILGIEVPQDQIVIYGAFLRCLRDVKMRCLPMTARCDIIKKTCEEINMLDKNIVKYRHQCGLSQSELASELNVVRQTVSKWEKGLSAPDAELLVKLSEVLIYCLSGLDIITAAVFIAPILTPLPFVFDRIFSEYGRIDKRRMALLALFSAALLAANIDAFLLLYIVEYGAKLLFMIWWGLAIFLMTFIPAVHGAVYAFIISRRSFSKMTAVLIYVISCAVFWALTAVYMYIHI